MFVCSFLFLGWQIVGLKFMGYANMLICILKLSGIWNIGKANFRGNLVFNFFILCWIQMFRLAYLFLSV